MIAKLAEHTYGDHIYMRMRLDDGRIEEIDVYLRNEGTVYRTSADAEMGTNLVSGMKTRQEIIDAFNDLY